MSPIIYFSRKEFGSWKSLTYRFKTERPNGGVSFALRRRQLCGLAVHTGQVRHKEFWIRSLDFDGKKTTKPCPPDAHGLLLSKVLSAVSTEALSQLETR